MTSHEPASLHRLDAVVRGEPPAGLDPVDRAVHEFDDGVDDHVDGANELSGRVAFPATNARYGRGSSATRRRSSDKLAKTPSTRIAPPRRDRAKCAVRGGASIKET